MKKFTQFISESQINESVVRSFVDGNSKGEFDRIELIDAVDTMDDNRDDDDCTVWFGNKNFTLKDLNDSSNTPVIVLKENPGKTSCDNLFNAISDANEASTDKIKFKFIDKSGKEIKSVPNGLVFEYTDSGVVITFE